MTTISLTPDEYRLVLVHKVERALNECGITNIDRQTVDQIAALLAPPKIGEVPIQKPTLRRQGVETNPVRGDKRARAYLPTHKARQVDSPASTDDKVINAILENAKIQRPCMLPDLQHAQIIVPPDML